MHDVLSKFKEDIRILCSRRVKTELYVRKETLRYWDGIRGVGSVLILFSTVLQTRQNSLQAYYMMQHVVYVWMHEFNDQHELSQERGISPSCATIREQTKYQEESRESHASGDAVIIGYESSS